MKITKKTLFTLALVTPNFSCSHRALRENVEARLAKQPMPTQLTVQQPYPIILNQAKLSQNKKSALDRIYTKLNEELTILKVRRAQLNSILSKEMLNPIYDKDSVKTIMKMLLDNTRRETWIKLEAMLNAKNVIRSRKWKKTDDTLRLSIEALNKETNRL
tara:strand:+ start:64 stop:543 length:480 start_codon:yes stop_codon:yes gene_type:complete